MYFHVGLVLTVTRNKIRIAESVETCIMATQTCPDCDSPGDGNCSACRGKGKTLREKISDAVIVFGHESICSVCGGSGDCLTCGGTGEMEAGGGS
jgi:DnaJ-class molecular chaperone